jgi:hypothetical protein
MLALRAVGDQDARIAKHYLKDQDDEMRRAFSGAGPGQRRSGVADAESGGGASR